MSTPWPRPMVVTSSRNGKTSPLSSMRRNSVSTADPPFYRSRDYRLTTGLPPVSRPFREKLHVGQLRAVLTLSAPRPDRPRPTEPRWHKSLTQHRGYLHPRSGVQISAITGVVKAGIPEQRSEASAPKGQEHQRGKRPLGRMVSILGRGAPGAGRSTCGGAAGRLAWPR